MIAYSTCFEVSLPNTPDGASRAAERAIELTRAWVLAWYSRRGEVSFEIPASTATTRPDADHLIEVKALAGASGRLLWSLTWTRPDEADATLRWSSTVVIARENDKAEFTLIIRVDPAQFEVRPVRVELRPPRIVRTLTGELNCTIGTRSVGRTPIEVRAPEVKRFSDSELRDPTRRVPCVVISPVNLTNRYAINPAKLAAYLSGLAEVYVLGDHWASYELRDELGHSLACYDGAVRIYWPGMGSPTDRIHHPYFTTEELQGRPESDDSGELKVFRVISRGAASRASAGELSRRVERLFMQERRVAQDAALAELKRRADQGDASVSELTRKLDELRAERDEALRLLEDERENRERAERQLVVIESARDDRPPAATESEPRSVEEAVEDAERLFGDRIIITETTRRAAAESPYRNANKVLTAFEALAELATAYFATVPAGQYVGPLEPFFRARGALDYAVGESMSTMGRFGGQRTLTYNGRAVTLERHLTLGGGSRENCLQLFWEFEPEQQKILVGHCGLHLDYAGHRT